MAKNTPAAKLPSMTELQAVAREHLAAASEFARLWEVGNTRIRWRNDTEEAAFRAAGTKADESGRRLADMLEAAGVPAIIVNNQIVGSLLHNSPSADQIADETGFSAGFLIFAVPLAGLGLRPANG